MIVHHIQHNQNHKSNVNRQLFNFRLVDLLKKQKNNDILHNIIHFKKVIHRIMSEIKQDTDDDDSHKNDKVFNISQFKRAPFFPNQPY